MELSRIAKRSFRVMTDSGQPIGVVQKHGIRRRWYFMAFEGCGISKVEINFNNLRELKDYLQHPSMSKAS